MTTEKLWKQHCHLIRCDVKVCRRKSRGKYKYVALTGLRHFCIFIFSHIVHQKVVCWWRSLIIMSLHSLASLYCTLFGAFLNRSTVTVFGLKKVITFFDRLCRLLLSDFLNFSRRKKPPKNCKSFIMQVLYASSSPVLCAGQHVPPLKQTVWWAIISKVRYSRMRRETFSFNFFFHMERIQLIEMS